MTHARSGQSPLSWCRARTYRLVSLLQRGKVDCKRCRKMMSGRGFR
jgi:hypothetical protein